MSLVSGFKLPPNEPVKPIWEQHLVTDFTPEQYGRCDRESKCSYHLNPYLDGYTKAVWEQEQGNRSELPNNWKPKRKKATPQPKYLKGWNIQPTITNTCFNGLEQPE